MAYDKERVQLSTAQRERLSQLTKEIEPLISEMAAIGVEALRGPQSSISLNTVNFRIEGEHPWKPSQICTKIGSPNIEMCVCYDHDEGSCWICA